MKTQEDFDGYTVAYDGEDLYFPVYVVLFTGLALLGWAFAKSIPYLLIPSAAALGYVYYNYPLLESGRPRLGAGQYGLFVEGLGIIAWRAIDDIKMVPVPARGVDEQELCISLSKPLDGALIADWRRRPVTRLMMRLPWSMKHGCIHISLDLFDRPPAEIHNNFMRLWRYFRS
jgi:hypothetical protein